MSRTEVITLLFHVTEHFPEDMKTLQVFKKSYVLVLASQLALERDPDGTGNSTMRTHECCLLLEIPSMLRGIIASASDLTCHRGSSLSLDLE